LEQYTPAISGAFLPSIDALRAALKHGGYAVFLLLLRPASFFNHF
jgi:hypothetical protein